MKDKIQIIPENRIVNTILTVRGKNVIADMDLAEVYGITVKRLREQVRRNINRFPEDFMFQLTKEEKKIIIDSSEHLSQLKFSPALPFVFTEHGALMAASIINSDTAAQISIYVVRAFVNLREMVRTHKDLAQKLNEMESKYDEQFQVVFGAIKELMDPEKQKRKPIGYK